MAGTVRRHRSHRSQISSRGAGRWYANFYSETAF